MVHRREIEGQELVFGNQGALYKNAMTLFDHDTGSVWSQPFGEALVGPRRGQRMELLPSQMTTWGAWREAHPETWALNASGRSSGFDLSDMSVVIEFGDEVVQYPILRLREGEVANDIVTGLEVAVLVDPTDGNRWAVFSRRLDDAVVRLAVRDGDLIDLESGTTFDPVSGRGIEGPLSAQTLDLLPGFTSFPWEFAQLWPHGRTWDPT